MESKIYAETATISGWEDYDELNHLIKLATIYIHDEMQKNKEANPDAYEYFRQERDRISKFSLKMMDQFFAKA